jgi:hypothetical protein
MKQLYMIEKGKAASVDKAAKPAPTRTPAAAKSWSDVDDDDAGEHKSGPLDEQDRDEVPSEVPSKRYARLCTPNCIAGRVIADQMLKLGFARVLHAQAKDRKGRR